MDSASKPATSKPETHKPAALNQEGLNLLFHAGRTFKKWQSKPVPQSLLEQVWEHAALPPTSFNSAPMRVVFVVSDQAKARLIPHLMEGNVPQVQAAPVTAIIAHDNEFHQQFSKLSPHYDPSGFFAGDEKTEFRHQTAFRNGTLQGGYFILAARAFGLDCGPMSGFNNQGVDAEFFAGTSYASNFLCNLGYGDDAGLHPRAPRLTFAEGASVV